MRIEKKLAILLLLLITYSSASSTTAMGLNQGSSKVLVYALPYSFETPSLFGIYQPGYSEMQWFSSMFVGLYQRDSASHWFVPVLAEDTPVIALNGTDFTSDNIAMKITVPLKHGLKFSNGLPLTAQDIVFTYQLLLNPDYSYNAMAWQYYFESNSSIYALDDYTIVFEIAVFVNTYYQLLNELIVPEEIYKPAVENGLTSDDFITNYDEYLIGAGPFMLDSYSDTLVTVIPNPNWFGTPTKLSEIQFKRINIANDAKQGLHDGTIDLIDYQYFIRKNELNDANTSKFLTLVEPSWYELSYNHLHPVFGDVSQQEQFLGTTYEYDSMNYTVTSYWFDHGVTDEATRRHHAKIVRQAMDTAIPRQDIIESFRGDGEPAATIWPSSSIGFDPSINPRAFDIALARSMMSNLGFDYNTLTYDSAHDTYTTFFFNVTFMAPSSATMVYQWIELVADAFERIGIGVENIVYDNWANIAPRTFQYQPTANQPVPLYNQGGYDVMLIGYYAGMEVDVSELYDSYTWRKDGGFNWYNWYDPTTYDPLSENYYNALTYDDLVNAAKSLQAYFFDQVIVSSVLHPTYSFITTANVTGIDPLLLYFGMQPWQEVDKIMTSPPTTSSPAPTTSNPTPTTNPNATTPETTTSSNLSIPYFAILLGFAITLMVLPESRRRKHF